MTSTDTEAATSHNRLELLQVADAVAREKGIERITVLGAMEEAIQKAARSKYGMENEIRAEIDGTTGNIRIFRCLEVCEDVENEATEISVAEARERNPDARVGDILAEPLPPIDFGRVAAQTAKQVIVQKVREAERERQYEEYKDRVGEIVNGTVKRVEYGNTIGRPGPGRRRSCAATNSIPRETCSTSATASAPTSMTSVPRTKRPAGHAVARTHPALHGQAVRPGSAGGLRRRRSRSERLLADPVTVARAPRSAVLSNDSSSIDPVGACVGMRGSSRSGGGRRTAGREDRYHQLVSRCRDVHRQCPRARRGHQGGARRRDAANRGGRPRRAAQSRHRSARSKCPARLSAHGLGHRHSDRGGGIRAPARGVPPAHPDVHRCP